MQIHEIFNINYFLKQVINFGWSIIFLIIVSLIYQKITMSRSHQRILQLHSLLSKLLDSLCFELAITAPDENSLSLLEILMWRRNNDVSQQQLKQLYLGWLQARNVFDLFKAKQLEPFPKTQLITIQMTQQNFMSVPQITKSLEVLNMLYNQFYLERKPNEKNNLDNVQSIFAYLDNQGLIHLRLSSLFYFCGSVLVCQSHTIPHSYDIFKVHLNQFRKQMCEIQGMVSLRCFKNFLLSYSQRNIIFKSFLDTCQDINKYASKGKKTQPINVMQQALQKWKLFPRFSNGSVQSKSRIQIYRRVFEQNQYIFFDKDPDEALEHFIHKYGQQFISCFDIDASLIRQFSTILKDILNHYIEVFRKVSQSHNKSVQSLSMNENSKFQQTARHKTTNYEIQPNQNIKFNKKTSQKQKTPTKQRIRKEDQFRNRTPKHQRQIIEIQRQFGSAQRVNRPQGSARQYTPTKSTQTATHHRNISTTLTGSKPSKPQFLPQTVTTHYQTSYFRNKRVQSYETVMRRFKKK